MDAAYRQLAKSVKKFSTIRPHIRMTGYYYALAQSNVPTLGDGAVVSIAVALSALLGPALGWLWSHAAVLPTLITYQVSLVDHILTPRDSIQCAFPKILLTLLTNIFIFARRVFKKLSLLSSRKPEAPSMDFLCCSSSNRQQGMLVHDLVQLD